MYPIIVKTSQISLQDQGSALLVFIYVASPNIHVGEITDRPFFNCTLLCFRDPAFLQIVICIIRCVILCYQMVVGIFWQ